MKLKKNIPDANAYNGLTIVLSSLLKSIYLTSYNSTIPFFFKTTFKLLWLKWCFFPVAGKCPLPTLMKKSSPSRLVARDCYLHFGDLSISLLSFICLFKIFVYCLITVFCTLCFSVSLFSHLRFTLLTQLMDWNSNNTKQ